jgi:signal transduction histidine kinase
MIRSLRLRLLLSFGLVIALSLVLAGFASMLLLRDQESQAAEERIGRLVDPLSRAYNEMTFVGWPQRRIEPQLAAYAEFFDVRVLLVDAEYRVVFDSLGTDSMTGEVLAVPVEGGASAEAGPGGTAFVSDRIRHGDRDLFVFASGEQPAAAVARLFPAAELSLVVAVPADDVTDAWARLVPRLLLAGGVAALFAVVVSTWLAQRITRPIVQMTHASQAMARGDYEQEIDVHGRDEVANLASAFNQMSAQVNRSSRSMRQLLADVSHELKTPLTSIQGFSQALADGVVEDPEEAQRLAEVVHEESERMRALVDDLLYLSRIESGELRLARDRVDLDALVSATERRLRYQAEAGEVSVRLELAGGAVHGDERRLEQVFANLIDNAIRFAPAGSAVVVGTARDGDFVVIEVQNGGNPIPADELSHIFDRFYQVDRARTGSGHSGLGLAIVAELVQAHGGTVDVRSNAEEGTVCTVRLPAHAPALPAQAPRRDT